VERLPQRDQAPPDRARRPGGVRREQWSWLAVTAAGCLLVLLAAGRPWAADVRVAGAPAGLAPPTGGDLGPALMPLALAGLAGIVAVLATRGAGRRIVGALLALCGLAAGLAAWAAAGHDDVLSWLGERNVLGGTAALTWDDLIIWPVVCGLGAALLLAGGLAVVARGGRWAAMSARYERDSGGTSREADGDRVLWDALDRGDDPTESR
jgi:uncharacterized membrane protein (TIGR02234 family)